MFIKSFLVFILMIINLSDLFSQETDTFRVDKKTDNFENFPLVFGLEFGVPVKFNKTYFESTFSGFMGIGFNKEKTFRIILKYGMLTPNKELSSDAYGFLNVGLTLRVLKFNDSRAFMKVGYTIVSTGDASFGGPSAGIIYEHKLGKIFSLSGSVDYPIIRASRYNEYYHNPFISLGFTFFSP